MKKSNITRQITDIKPATARKHESQFDWRKFLVTNQKFIIAAALVMIVVIVGLIYHQHQSPSTKSSSGQSQINDTVDKVSKLILLPTGEQPTLAIVNDASKYNNVTFFKNAANGDRLLVYAQAREAILYRPSINKIISVAPLSPNSQPPNSPAPKP